jgi:hypothetical protein
MERRARSGGARDARIRTDIDPGGALQSDEEHGDGDSSRPYVRWAGAMQFRRSAEENARMKRSWAYLASALAAVPRGAGWREGFLMPETFVKTIAWPAKRRFVRAGQVLARAQRRDL